jgi:predicted transposase/invertase (TIGR01784 family)
MKLVQFTEDDRLLNPCWDNVFKAVFTKESPESRGALCNLLSAIIRRDVKVLSVTANEPPIDNIRDRQILFDISVKLDNGELSNIEMTMHTRTFELLRLEYYAGKLYLTQDIRGAGRGYHNLQKTYQISLVNTSVVDDPSFIHEFEYYDRTRDISLHGHSLIITVELSKLTDIVKKPIAEMSAVERWAVFFRYCLDGEKRDLINALMRHEEGITMASEALLTVSKDEITRARLLSEYKFEVDLQSDMAAAKQEGREELAQNLRDLGVPIETINAALQKATGI